MPLEFEKIEDIPEPLREDFIQLDEGDKKWVPKGYIPEAVHSEMKGRMSKQSGRLKELEDTAKRWGEDDPDALRTSAADAAKAAKRVEKLQAELDAAVKAKAEAEAKGAGEDPKKVDQLIKEAREALRAELAEQHRTEVEEHATKYGDLERQLKERDTRLDVLEIDHQVDTASARVSGFRKEVSPLARLLARQVFQRGKDGRVLPYGEDGKVIFDGDKPMVMEKWLAGLRDEPATRGWFDAPASGGGTNGDNPKSAGKAGKTKPADDRGNMSAAEQAEFAREGGEFV